jgi:hypothetical protein
MGVPGQRWQAAEWKNRRPPGGKALGQDERRAAGNEGIGNW